jgi:hypothetical protein
MPNVSTNAPLQLDDNLVNGQTYTFQFLLGNWITSPSVTTLQNDIQAQAPDFLQSVQVTEQSGAGLLTNWYFVRFTYEGDGSDVVSDVVNSFIAAFSTGSNDAFTFVQAVGGPPPQSAALDQVQEVTQSVATTVGNTVGTAVSGSLQGVTSGLGVWVVPLALIAGVVLLFQLNGLRGLRATTA